MSPLPAGLVTLLFADTEHLLRPGDSSDREVRLALAHRDRVLINIVVEESGCVVKHAGDGLRAVFAGAPTAVRAAVRMQNALLDLRKNGGVYGIAPRVRFALHTGRLAGSSELSGSSLEAEAEALLRLGPAGQIVLSDSTREAIREKLPFEVALRDVGTYAAQKMTAPGHAWQIQHTNLTTRHPEVRSTATATTNLPLQTTAFIGRKREITEIRAMLGQSRFVTLTGEEGIGKTRLALEVGRLLLDTFPDGVWQVPLAGLSDMTQIQQATARNFGLREIPGGSLQDALVDFIKCRRLLLVCDQYDHMTADCSEFATSLLSSCPGVYILATGSGSLGAAEERTYPVPALLLPPMPKGAEEQLEPYLLVRYESSRLFLNRGRTRQPGLSLSAAGATALCHLCHQLNGVPLALEIAAAHVGSLTVEQITTYLSNYFLMNNATGTGPPGPQPLQLVLDWSYALLGPKERLLLLRLSVFSGTWSLEAAEAICSDSGEDCGHNAQYLIERNEIAGCVKELADKSLVICIEQGGQPRYGLAQSIRTYAQKRLEHTKEGACIRERHCNFYFRMVQGVYEDLKGPARRYRQNLVERDHDNIRAALEEALNTATVPSAIAPLAAIERLLLFTGSLEPYWRLCGLIADARHYLATALAVPGAREPARARVLALNSAATLARVEHEQERAAALYEESLTIAQTLEDKEGIAAALDNLAQTAREHGDYRRAQVLLEQAIEVNRQSFRRKAEASNWNQLGSLSWVRADHGAAIAQFSEAVVLQRGLSHERVIASAHTTIGLAALDRGEYKIARTVLTEGLKLWNRLGDHGHSTTLLALAKLACLEGKKEWAGTLLAAAKQSPDARHEPVSCADRDDQEKLEAWLLACLEEVRCRGAMLESESPSIDHILTRLQCPNAGIASREISLRTPPGEKQAGHEC